MVRLAGWARGGGAPVTATADTNGFDRTAADDLAGAAFALARRFAAGATMWCVSPEWPEHARHVAVEFVHPVIMGKRALPAVAVFDDDPVPALRALARSGDVVCAVGSAATPSVCAVMQRARVWGCTTIWIGAGAERPLPGAADHVLWTDAPGASAAYDGRIVFRYHLLWELTHVCFEHPGLLTDTEADDGAPTGCITCGDAGVVAEVLAIDPRGLAVVRTANGTETIDTSLSGPVQPYDMVLVHAGTAITRVDAVS